MKNVIYIFSKNKYNLNKKKNDTYLNKYPNNCVPDKP